MDLEARKKLEAALLSRIKAKRAKATGIQRIDRDAPMPLMPVQRGLLFRHHLSQTPQSFNVATADYLDGQVDLAALSLAVGDVVARHEALSLCVVKQAGIPTLQAADNPPRLEILTPSFDEAECKDAQTRALIDAVVARPFDLAQEAPLRLLAYQIDDGRVLLITVVHHIAVDEWSMRILRADLGACYEARLQDRPAKLPKLTVQIPDIAAWQIARLASGALDDALNYWTDKLRNADPTVTIAPTRPMVAGTPKHTGTFEIELASVGLDAVGRAEQATPYMTMLSAIRVYLHLLTGQTDLALATQVSGRSQPEMAAMVGMFTNTSVIRTSTNLDPSFRALIQCVKEQTLASLKHQDMPFDTIVRKLKVSTITSDQPFSRLIFTHRKSFDEPSDTDPLKRVRLPAKLAETRGAPRFDIWFAVIDRTDTRTLKLVYDTARYSRDSVKTIARDISALSGALQAAPDSPISSFASYVTALDTFSRGDSGSSAASAASDQVEVDPETETKLAALWCEILRVETAPKETSFFEGGGDSLLIMQLLHRIGQTFGVEPSMAEVFQTPTLRGIGRVIDTMGDPSRENGLKAEAAPEDPLLVPLGKRPLSKVSAAGPAKRYFVVSGAGGHVLPFAPAASHFDNHWEGIGLLDPFLSPNEAPLASLEAVAARLIASMEHVDQTGPYLLVGYSYGGYVVHEMILQLRARGLTAGMIVLDTPFTDRTSLWRQIWRARRSLRWLKPKNWVKADTAAALYDKKTAETREERRVIGNRQRKLKHNYQPTWADTDLVVIRANGSITKNTAWDYGWSNGGRVLKVIDVPGDHISLIKPQNEVAFAAALERALNILRDASGKGKHSGPLP